MISSPRSRPLRLLPVAALLLASACAGTARPGTRINPDMSAVGEAPRTAGAQPLGGLVGQRVLLLPAQRLTASAEVAELARERGALLRRLDDELAFALDERGLGATWTTGAEASQLARRNPSYAVDPTTLPVASAAGIRAGDPVREPLGSQLRALAALADARWAVLPVELRADAGDGTPRAVVRLALVDVRTAQVLWVGETAAATATPSQSSDPAALGGTLAARAAAHFLDLLMAPREP